MSARECSRALGLFRPGLTALSDSWWSIGRRHLLGYCCGIGLPGSMLIARTNQDTLSKEPAEASFTKSPQHGVELSKFSFFGAREESALPLEACALRPSAAPRGPGFARDAPFSRRATSQAATSQVKANCPRRLGSVNVANPNSPTANAWLRAESVRQPSSALSVSADAIGP